MLCRIWFILYLFKKYVMVWPWFHLFDHSLSLPILFSYKWVLVEGKCSDKRNKLESNLDFNLFVRLKWRYFIRRNRHSRKYCCWCIQVRIIAQHRLCCHWRQSWAFRSIYHRHYWNYYLRTQSANSFPFLCEFWWKYNYL